MRIPRCVLSLLAIIVLPTTFGFGQTPAKEPTASISGHVTISGKAAAGITVVATMSTSVFESKTVAKTTTDEEGNYKLSPLAAGRFSIMPIAKAFVVAAGDRYNPPGQPVNVAEGETITKIDFPLVRGGVITGRITDAESHPLIGERVSVSLKDNKPDEGAQMSMFGGSKTQTDDRGVYRAYGLGLGSYKVSVGQAASAGGAVTTFLSHAGTTAVLSLGIVGVADPRRGFSFNGVADGEYDLMASFFASPTENGLVGTKRVTVRGGDVTGVELRLASLASISGTITLDTIKPEDKCDKRRSQVIETILNVPHDEPKKGGNQSILSMFGGSLGTLNDKGEFALRNLEAGRYRVDISLPTESWYVRAITLPAAVAQPVLPESQPAQPPAAKPNQSNPWQGVVTIKSGQRIAGVSILVGQDAAGLRGRVTLRAEGTVIPAGSRVHLVPADREQANNVLRYSEALVNSDGSFALTNIAPGRYFILSRVDAPIEMDAPSRPIAWDPVMRAKLRREAEGANMVVELKPCQRMVDYALKIGG
jgi:hypothetical protein